MSGRVSGSAPSVARVLVLGGGSDIAAATLAELLPSGLSDVVLAMRRPDATAVDLPGVTVTALEWDATDVASHEALFDRAEELLGTIDVVLCAVGLLGHHAGYSMGAEDVADMAAANFAGPAAALSVAGRRLAAQRSGAIIALSSIAGVRPRRSNYVYGSTKSGLDAFARGLCDAVADDGVRVLVVRPGFVRSSMTVGLDPAPFATTPDVVGRRIADALVSGRSGVVWVPKVLGPLFTVLAQVPTPLWRRIASDR